MTLVAVFSFVVNGPGEILRYTREHGARARLPGLANQPGANGLAPLPVFSREGGVYQGPLSLAVSTGDAGVGSEPSSV